MDLAEALRLLAWTSRDEISRAALKQACSVVLRHLREMLPERSGNVPDDENAEIVQQVVVNLWNRQEPLSSPPPPDVASARSYLKQAIRNARTSMLRKKASQQKLQRALAAEQSSGNRWRGLPRTEDSERSMRDRVLENHYEMFRVPTQKMGQDSVFGSGEANVTTQPYEEDEELLFENIEEQRELAALHVETPLPDAGSCSEEQTSLVRMLDVLEKRVKGVARLRLQDRDWEELSETLGHFRQAVLKVVREARTAEARRQSLETFDRLVRCVLEETTMHQEVLRECGGEVSLDSGSPKYRTMRNRLDQRKSRFLSRVMEQMIAQGASREAAARLIKAFALKGSEDVEPCESQKNME